MKIPAARLVFGEQIARSKKIALLSTDAELLFLRAIVNLDGGNKIIGDPSLLLATIHPRSITHFSDKIEDAIQEWVEVGLVEIIPAEDEQGDDYIRFIEAVGCDYVDPNADR